MASAIFFINQFNFIVMLISWAFNFFLAGPRGKICMNLNGFISGSIFPNSKGLKTLCPRWS